MVGNEGELSRGSNAPEEEDARMSLCGKITSDVLSEDAS